MTIFTPVIVDAFVMDPDIGGPAFQTVSLGEPFFPTDVMARSVIKPRLLIESVTFADSVAASRWRSRALLEAIDVHGVHQPLVTRYVVPPLQGPLASPPCIGGE